MTKNLVALLVGIAVGILTSRYLFVSSWLGLVPWSIGGMLLGSWCQDKKQAALVGAIYGFFLLFSFMFGGYAGANTQASRIMPFVVLGLAGSLGGIVLAEIGVFLKRK